MNKIDAHIHYNGDHPDSMELLDQLQVRPLNICVAQDNHGQWRWKMEIWRTLAEQNPHRYAWCTSFDAPRFGDPGYVNQVMEQLEQDFQAGAIACKIWKNVGMEIKRPSGEFLMIDDPLFDPIFDYLEQVNVTLIAHLAEPLACWQSLIPGTPHYNYYRMHPEWHMVNKPGFPSHGEILEARDRMLDKHPGLRVVGAHLGSLEYDVAEIVARLDRYPNFAVDTSARLLDLALQDTETVRKFFIDYQDRILFGTDIVRYEPVSTLSEEERQNHIEHIRSTYQRRFDFFETEQTISTGGQKTQGLGLPGDVLERFYTTNAINWFPALQDKWNVQPQPVSTKSP